MNFREATFRALQEILLSNQRDFGEIYLVGGYIRDHLLGCTSHDFDFVIKNDAIKDARIIANHFNGAFYILDKTRQTARALINIEGERIVVDCTLLHPHGILSDLRQRDFTINAMAVDLKKPDDLIDPLGGYEDLVRKRLRLCNDDSLLLDPIRIVRSVRFTQSYSLSIPTPLKEHIRETCVKLVDVSNERLRDEIINLFSIKKFIGSIELMDELGMINFIFPEISSLKKIPPLKPHVNDAFTHTIRTINTMSELIRSVLFENYELHDEKLFEARQVLEKYINNLKKYFLKELTPGRTIMALAHFAALYHDATKSYITAMLQDGKYTFPGHAEMSAQLASQRATTLAFSGIEVDFIQRLVANHMIEETYFRGDKKTRDLYLYKFFKKAKLSSVAVCFLHLADIKATYEEKLSNERWANALECVHQVLDGWFNRYDEVVEPKKLIDGYDLINEFGLKPSKSIGNLLETIREKQVSGEVSSKEDALEFLRRHL